MSKFLSEAMKTIEPYTPGEQPIDVNKWIKLNTNENPYNCSDKAQAAAACEAKDLRLYNDPTSGSLYSALSDTYDVDTNMVYGGNGSDEVLVFCLMAYGAKGVAFPDITYGFYPSMALLLGVKYIEIPLREDMTIDIDDYKNITSALIISNPNAPTGIVLKPSQIIELLEQNRERLVIVDEAYVDFGAESCIGLTKKYDNILVTGTLSKSRSLAGARVGFAIGNPELINDLNSIKYSFNPYNINRMSLAASAAALKDNEYFALCRNRIIATRQRISDDLTALGFELTDSKANFIFAKCPKGTTGEFFYEELKKRKILVRHWNKPRIGNYLRITVGEDASMDILIKTIKDILRGV